MKVHNFSKIAPLLLCSLFVSGSVYATDLKSCTFLMRDLGESKSHLDLLREASEGEAYQRNELVELLFEAAKRVHPNLVPISYRATGEGKVIKVLVVDEAPAIIGTVADGGIDVFSETGNFDAEQVIIGRRVYKVDGQNVHGQFILRADDGHGLFANVSEVNKPGIQPPAKILHVRLEGRV